MAFSLDYLWRYVVAGVALLLVASLFMSKFGYLVALHVWSAILILPGAIVVNFAGQYFFPSRTWAGDPRRAKLAGWASVPVIWGMVVLSTVFEMEPRFLKERFGMIEACLIHIAGMIIVGSTLSLALGWALPPKPPVKVRRK